ncbi:MAG TPA: proline dehydrogenase family protein [Saprospiraceae bacterium]|nr:proline dehydrogenase family protein [Saprospiraceae bacterium]
MNIKIPDFSNTEIAFSTKTDAELNKMHWLFDKMNKPWLVKLGTQFGLFAIRFNFPFAQTILKNTLFEQFCGGRTLLECMSNVDKLASKDIYTILDYGAEGKDTENDFNLTMNQVIRSIEFAAQQPYINLVSVKLTGLGRFGLLEKLHNKEVLDSKESEEYNNLVKRIDSICYNAHNHNIGVFIDAEETWIQNPVDDIVDKMMARYNTQKPIVYNTFQMYRTASLSFLKASHVKAKNEGYILGAKLVRGAYMEKERKRAEDLGYESPIHVSKEATDNDFNLGITYCIENINEIGSCCASHNQQSNLLYAQLIDKNNIPGNHPHIMTSQLYGMSDHLTFNLAESGIHASKFMPYGPVKDVMPYLMRRAQENTSVTGDMSREFDLIDQEVKRRKKN